MNGSINSINMNILIKGIHNFIRENIPNFPIKKHYCLRKNRFICSKCGIVGYRSSPTHVEIKDNYSKDVIKNCNETLLQGESRKGEV